jgi:fatty acyl-CoA reductase
VYEKLKELRGADIFQKLVSLAGDVGEDNLGLSPADRRLLTENVNVVFHSAATLDFEATLRPSVNINLLGTRRVVQLCKEISHLEVACLLCIPLKYEKQYYISYNKCRLIIMVEWIALMLHIWNILGCNFKPEIGCHS